MRMAAATPRGLVGSIRLMAAAAWFDSGYDP